MFIHSFLFKCYDVSFLLQGHENEKEKLIMGMETVIEELASLETQLSSLRAQINNLASEVEEQKAKVKDFGLPFL